MNILAIDTSCDDTSVAVSNDRRILTNCVSSQIEMHKKTGGVVPIDAARAHNIKIKPLIELALKKAKLKISDIDAIAVTYGPGLAPALEVGLLEAKELAINNNIPLIPVNHMSGHTYANWAQNSKGKNGIENDKWPVIALLISGGHTEIVLMKSHFDFEIIGETLDDACGECFDKVGRMLGLGYPAGPVIEKFADKGDESMYELPRPMQHTDDFNVSYSGLKTASFRLIRTLSEKNYIQGSIHLDQDKIKAPPGTEVFKLSKQEIYDVCASFQKAAMETILIKYKKAIERYKPQLTVLGGGVVKNKYLRKKAREIANSFNVDFYYPEDKLIMDNAGMIAIAAYYQFLSKKNILSKEEEILALEREPGLRF